MHVRIERPISNLSVLSVSSVVGLVLRTLARDADLRPRVEAILVAAQTTLAAHAAVPGPAVADALNELLGGVRTLELPARDPVLEATPPALEQLGQVLGTLAIRLLNALDAAKAVGWEPVAAELPVAMTAMVPVGGALGCIALLLASGKCRNTSRTHRQGPRTCLPRARLPQGGHRILRQGSPLQRQPNYPRRGNVHLIEFPADKLTRSLFCCQTFKSLPSRISSPSSI